MAAAKIAQKLQWPCLVDVLSGLRPQSNTSPFISCSDCILTMAKRSWDAIRPEVILQMGGHLTSKRLIEFLYHSRSVAPETQWVIVTNGRWRDDPQHCITAKCDLSLPDFLGFVENTEAVQHPSYLSLWTTLDQSVNGVMERQFHNLSFAPQLTEPYVSYTISRALPIGHGLFIGNSMPVRDMNQFGIGVDKESGLAFLDVAANRGASGIDGVVSSAIGYASGLKSPVTVLIGDVSFLHDTNGLSFLKRTPWPPLVLVVVNNKGGGIFDFLPVSNSVSIDMFDALWSMPQDVNIEAMLQPYAVSHTVATTPREFNNALHTAWNSHQHSVVEVKTDRKGNVALHKSIHAATARAAQRATDLCSQSQQICYDVTDLSWTVESFSLNKSIPTKNGMRNRDCVKIWITLTSATGTWTGMGEASPLPDLHTETLEDVKMQMRYFQSAIRGKQIPRTVCLLDGSLNNWFSDTLGVRGNALCPSLRFGLQSALLTAMSLSTNQSLYGLYATEEGTVPAVKVNALLGALSDVESGIDACEEAIEHGYSVVKMKVGRKTDPVAEAQIVNGVSKAMGDRLTIRLDGNGAWDLENALRFAEALNCPTLEYIEDPVASLEDVQPFIEATQLPCALDFAINSRDASHVSEILQKCPGIGYCVIKPGQLGSLDDVIDVMETCAVHKRRIVVTSLFESQTGLAILTEIAAMADEIMNRAHGIHKGSIHHGLATLHSFNLDPLTQMAAKSLLTPILTLSTTRALLNEAHSGVPLAESRSQQSVTLPSGEIRFGMCEVGRSAAGTKPVLLFLHGMFGCSSDWLPIMHALSHRFYCVAIDLPGHGDTHVQSHQDNTAADDDLYLFGNVVEGLRRLVISRGLRLHGVVGYSLGGRLGQSLVQSLRCSYLFSVSSVPCMSQSPDRLALDIEMAHSLLKSPSLETFLRSWYEGNQMWRQLTQRQGMYESMLQTRCVHQCRASLAKAMIGMSAGRKQPSIHGLFEDGWCDVMVLIGGEDGKYLAAVRDLDTDNSSRFLRVIIDGCGHALIIESGLMLAAKIFESC